MCQWLVFGTRLWWFCWASVASNACAPFSLFGYQYCVPNGTYPSAHIPSTNIASLRDAWTTS